MHPSVAYQAVFLSPITTALILVLIAVYVLNPTPPSSVQRMSFSYKSVMEEKSFMRLITTEFYHRNFIHLILTVSILWGCMRYVEMENGSLFVLGYSFVLGVISNSMYLVICEFALLYGNGVLLADHRINGDICLSTLSF
jgi:membrane associated rhomboid family serine protease